MPPTQIFKGEWHLFAAPNKDSMGVIILKEPVKTMYAGAYAEFQRYGVIQPHPKVYLYWRCFNLELGVYFDSFLEPPADTGTPPTTPKLPQNLTANGRTQTRP